MDREQIRDRLYVLFIALQFSWRKHSVFTVGERIVINQERGALMALMEKPFGPRRQVPEAIEQKISAALRLMRDYRWEPPAQDEFNNDLNTDKTQENPIL